MEKLNIALNIATAAGTLAAGVVAVIGLVRVLRRFTYKNETLIGEEARERYEKIERTALAKAKLVKSYEFSGGPTSLIPRFRVERVPFNPQTMPPELKGCTQSLRYVDYDKETGKPIEKVWWLK